MKTEDIERLINAVDFWVSCDIFKNTNFSPQTDDAKRELAVLKALSITAVVQAEPEVCGNCGCGNPKKTYDGYWCKMCHNEM